MKKFLIQFVASLCFVISGCESVSRTEFKETQTRIQVVQDRVEQISVAQKEASQSIGDVKKTVDILSVNIDKFKAYINTQVEDFKFIAETQKFTGESLAVDNAELGHNSEKIKDETGKINTHLVGVPESTSKTGISESNFEIARLNSLNLQLIEKTKTQELAISAIQKRAEAAEQRAEQERKNADEQSKQAMQAKTAAATAEGKVQELGRQADAAKQETKQAMSSAKDDETKMKQFLGKIQALQDQNQKKIYTILYCFLTLGILLMFGGGASLIAQFLPPRIGIAGIIAGALMFALSSCLIRWLAAFQIAGLVILCSVGVGLVIYLVWRFSMTCRQNEEIVEFVDHSKTVMSDDIKEKLFSSENNIASLAQSDSTKQIVSEIKAKRQKLKSKIAKSAQKVAAKIKTAA